MDQKATVRMLKELAAREVDYIGRFAYRKVKEEQELTAEIPT
jgi:hypothetical protein